MVDLFIIGIILELFLVVLKCGYKFDGECGSIVVNIWFMEEYLEDW